MSISVRDRKLLWSKSGNRCAKCRGVLCEAVTGAVSHSVLGDECHIVAQAGEGPRGTPEAISGLDSYNNLILLCPTDHRVVDQQFEIYTPDVLRLLKRVHEEWVESTLSMSAIQVEEGAKFTCEVMYQVTSGKQLLEYVLSSHGRLLDHDELKSEQEVDVITGLASWIEDLQDIGENASSSASIRDGFNLQGVLDELEQAGFLLFGTCVKRPVGFVGDPPMNIQIVVLRVVRSNSGRYMRSNQGNVILAAVPMSMEIGL